MSEPFIAALVNGSPVKAGFYNRLISATIVDNAEGTADTCDLLFDDKDNSVEIPASGASIALLFGNRPEGAVKMGLFKIERPGIKGGPQGEFVRLSGQSAEFSESLKEPLDEHFDDQSAGDIVRELASRHGYSAKVSERFDGIKMPYMARNNQSSVDFLSRLARRTGAQFSIKDGKFLFLERGILSAITINKSECESWDFSVEPRPANAKTEAGWYDRAKNKITYEQAETGLKGPSKRSRNVFSSQGEAKAAAKGVADRQSAKTGSGSITMGGRTDILAGSMLNLTGFRDGAAGLWYVKSVSHAYSDNYMITAQLEAPKEGKSA